MDLDIKREALNHAVALGIAAVSDSTEVTGDQLVTIAKAFEAYLTGGDAK